MRRVLVHIDRLVRLASRSRSDRVDAGHVGIGPAGSLRPVGAQIALGIAKGITS
jgi:hypothetical protein